MINYNYNNSRHQGNQRTEKAVSAFTDSNAIASLDQGDGPQFMSFETKKEAERLQQIFNDKTLT
jgi:hypothetical protein